MSGMAGFMTFVFLIVVSPVLLMMIANPWSFPVSLAVGWAIVAAGGTPVLWSWFRHHHVA
uniref:Uncharacterized protein n=1 Tax=Geobacter metallireducens TaxID=28232 RepID=A0A831UE72_GEOME